MKLKISYGVVFGRGDASDRIEYGVIELSDEEAKAAIEIALTGEYDDILELEELRETRDSLCNSIEEIDIENNLDLEDEYTTQCQGMTQMDIDELNDLVHNKDAHALAFFRLEDASDDEIEEWDAEDLGDIPTIAEFTPGFEPISPYDDGWILNLFVDNVIISEEELTDYLNRLFLNSDYEKIDCIRQWSQVEFDRNIEDIIFDIAQRMNCKEYINSCNE